MSLLPTGNPLCSKICVWDTKSFEYSFIILPQYSLKDLFIFYMPAGYFQGMFNDMRKWSQCDGKMETKL